MQWRSSRRMRDKKGQNGVVKLARLHLGKEMTTARKELDLCPRSPTRELLGEICRSDEIVFGAVAAPPFEARTAGGNRRQSSSTWTRAQRWRAGPDVRSPRLGRSPRLSNVP